MCGYHGGKNQRKLRGKPLFWSTLVICWLHLLEVKTIFEVFYSLFYTFLWTTQLQLTLIIFPSVTVKKSWVVALALPKKRLSTNIWLCIHANICQILSMTVSFPSIIHTSLCHFYMQKPNMNIFWGWPARRGGRCSQQSTAAVKYSKSSIYRDPQNWDWRSSFQKDRN